MPDDLDVIRRAKAGDHAAQTELLEQHAGAIFKLAIRYARSYPWAGVDDLYQVGRLGFLRGIEKWQEGRANLLTFALKHARSFIGFEAGKGGVIRVGAHALSVPALQEDANRALKCVSLDCWQQGLHSRVNDPAWPEHDKPCWDEADLAELRLALTCLDDREQQVVEARYHGKLLFRDIGEQIGVTHERARQIHDGALRKLKRWLEKHAGHMR